MVVPDKSVPHNIEAEEAVIGALLIDPEGIFRVLSFLRAEHFYLQKHRWLYEAIVALHERREPIDFLTLTTELENREHLEAVGGAAYVAQLIDSVPSAINIESYARMVEQTFVRRRLLNTASEIARFAHDEDLPITEVVDKIRASAFCHLSTAGQPGPPPYPGGLEQLSRASLQPLRSSWRDHGRAQRLSGH